MPRAVTEDRTDRRSTSRRGPSSRSEIICAGLRLGSAGGIGAVTVRGVASELRRSPMGLYRYIDGAHDLRSAVQRAAFASWTSGDRTAIAALPSEPVARIVGLMHLWHRHLEHDRLRLEYLEREQPPEDTIAVEVLHVLKAHRVSHRVRRRHLLVLRDIVLADVHLGFRRRGVAVRPLALTGREHRRPTPYADGSHDAPSSLADAVELLATAMLANDRSSPAAAPATTPGTSERTRPVPESRRRARSSSP